MRACEQYEVWIQLSLDKMLPSEEQAQLEAHLAQCPACRACYQQFEAMKTMLAGLDEQEEAPPQLHQRIMTYVARQEGSAPVKKPRRFRRWVYGAAGIAACLLLAFGGMRLFPGMGASSSADSGPAETSRDQLKAAQWVEDEADIEGNSDGIGGAGLSMLNEPENTAGGEDDLIYFSGDYPTEAARDLDEFNKQIAMDLAPASPGTAQSAGKEEEKILFVTGSRDALPEWAQGEALFTQVIDGAPRDCVELSLWKEESVVSELTESGFSVEPAELENAIQVKNDRLLLVFFWE